jgi:uncharacterized membrane protein YeiB
VAQLVRARRDSRIVDLDVTRAVALIGVAVMNYHGYLLGKDPDQYYTQKNFAERVFDPWEGPLSTRFAATFCLIAGMGVTLMTNRSRLSGDGAARSVDRWRLVRRGLLLYAFGAVLDWLWPGTILFFYGAMFMIGAVLFTLPIRYLTAVGSGAAVAAAVLRWWVVTGDHASFDNPKPGTVRGLLLDTFVNGTHPLLPWLAFFCAGMVLARFLPLPVRLRGALVVAGVVMVAITYGVRTTFRRAGATTQLVTSTAPDSRSLVYTLCALGSALVAFAVVGALANATVTSPITSALAATGRMTLTLYVGHVMVFHALVYQLEWVRPTGLDTALLLALGYWVVAVLLAVAWERAVGIGPLEWLYRRFGG